MAYIPIVTPPAHVPPPSPRVRELASLLGKVLQEYTKAHPATTSAEIRAAVRMAMMSAGPDRGKTAAALSLTLGLGVAVLTFGLVFFQRSGGVNVAILPMVILGIVVFLAIVLIMVKRGG